MELDLERLKRRKKELGISFDELSIKSGIPKTTLTNIFGGHTAHPRIDTIKAIEQALGMNEKSPPAGQEGKGLVIPEKYKDVAVAFAGGTENLTQEDINDIVRFIEFTKDKAKRK